jgi:20S proteasome alpha/beta subunit
VTSKPWPFNKLKTPAPADWGIGMTICITAICEAPGDEAIITACDKMVSMGGYVSGEKNVRKIDPILYNWTLMFAANDISPSTPVVNEILGYLTPRTLHEVADIVKRAYKNQRNRQIEDDILQPVGFSLNSFLSDGKAQLSERTYERIFDRIESYDLGIEFLVQGYDSEKNNPHIFTVANPGKCNFYDKVGFWAIGSGQHEAIASLFATEYRKFDALATCVAKILVAKFMAESSVGVGKETWLLVARKDFPNKTVFIDPPIQQKVRDEYAALPKIPSNALGDIGQAIEEQTQKWKAEVKPQLISQMLKPGQVTI